MLRKFLLSFYFVTLYLALQMSSPVQGQNVTGENLLEEAINSYQFMEYKKSISKLEQAVKHLQGTANKIKAYKYMGASYIALDREEEGLVVFEKLLALKPEETLDPSEFSPIFLNVFRKAQKPSKSSLSLSATNKAVGAVVSLNGKLIGKLKQGQPLQTTVKPGKHKVKASKKGYKSQLKSITVQKGEMHSLTFDLQKIEYGDLEIVSNVSGGKIYIDGNRQKGITLSHKRNTRVRNVETGPHTLKIVHGNYHTFETKLSLTSQKTVILNVDMEPLKGSIEIFVDKKGTEIFLEDRSYGKTHLANDLVAIKNLKPGKYSIRGKLKTYKSVTKTVEIKPGAIKKIKFYMLKSPTLTIMTDPPGADVFINDAPLGKSPVKYNLTSESLVTLTVMHEGYAERKFFIGRADKNRKILNVTLVKKEAYAHYLNGLEEERNFENTLFKQSDQSNNIQKTTPKDFLNKSEQFFKKSVEADSTFSAALSASGRILLKSIQAREGTSKSGINGIIVNALVASTKAIEKDNDPLATGMGHENLGNIYLYKSLDSQNDKKTERLLKSIKSFESAVGFFDQGRIDLSFKPERLAETYFSRAIAYEKIAQNLAELKKGGFITALEKACSAWSLSKFSNVLETLDNNTPYFKYLKNQTAAHKKKYCDLQD